MKTLVTTLGILLLIGAIAIPVLAHDSGWGRGGHMMGGKGYHHGYDRRHCGYGSHYGRGFDRMTGEQSSKLDNLHKKFYDDTAALREQLWKKSEALNTVLNASSPDAEKAKALQKEVSDLRAKLSQARIDCELEARKVNPDLRMGMGYGNHMKDNCPFTGYGPHMGMGYGRQMRGYEPGECWK